MSHFLNTHANRVDAKGRVSIPAPFRTALRTLCPEGEVPLVLRTSHNHACVEGWPTRYFQALGTPLQQMDVFGADQEDMAVSIYADALYVESDKEGRIVLPDALMQHAGLTDMVLFMGLGRTFQIWQPEAGQRYMADARERARTRRLTLPGTPQAAPG
jgi:MraZ protein